MSIKITIETVDRTSDIDVNSVRLNRTKTSQSSSLSFDVIREDQSAYKPSVDDEVSITDIDGTTVLFAGRLVALEENIQNGNVEVISCTCQDYTYDMDALFVKQIYEDMTVAQIIEDIKDTILTGFTTTNVVCDVTVSYISFNYEQPSKCIQQLADLVGYEWFVDNNKDINFFSRSSEVAPFNLDDTAGKYYIDSLKIKRDIKNLRNKITVRGGTFLGASFTETTIADGNQVTFLQAYGYSSVVVTVATVSKTVGIDNIDDPADFDCLYNFQEKAVKFRSDNKPTSTQAVAVSGNPHLPVIVSVLDSASAGVFGIREYKVIDNSINTKQGARDRARAELISYAQTLNEGQFVTNIGGLRPGQIININSAIRSYDEDFVISKISSSIRNPSEFVHTVSLVTTKTFGVIEFLQMLLMQKDKEIKIDENEVIDNVFNFSDDFTFSDDMTIGGISALTYQWTSGLNPLVWNFGVWGLQYTYDSALYGFSTYS